MRLANIDEDEGDERELLVVGTGTSLPDRKETTEGRILGFEVSSSARKLKLVFQKVVRGNVFALAQVSRFVAAAINSEVVLYSQQQQGQADDDWPDDDAEGDSRMLGQDEKGDLTERGRWSAAFTAITLSSPQEKLLVVGDALRSLVVLRVNDVAGASKANVLQEMSRDCDPYWTTAAEQIDAGSQTYIGADIAFNLYTSQRLALSDDAQRNRKEAILKNIEAGQTPDEDDVLQHSDGWSRIMERRGAYHYGDLVNKFRRASLVGSASSRRDAPTTLTRGSSLSRLPAPLVSLRAWAKGRATLRRRSSGTSMTLSSPLAVSLPKSEFLPVTIRARCRLLIPRILLDSAAGECLGQTIGSAPAPASSMAISLRVSPP
ncbi:hypothetical protein L7F22_029859 [Adiantum nelumboides]|nr:hypothetical protein [Adiantum nelumboides]